MKSIVKHTKNDNGKYSKIENDIAANFYRLDKVERITGKQYACEDKQVKTVSQLPLIVRDSQWVKFSDRFFSLHKEGLYRFWYWGTVRWESRDSAPKVVNKRKQYSCVILFREDVLALLSGIATLHVHGSIHQTLPFRQQVKQMKRGLLSLTCGYIADFCCRILKRAGWQTRRVAALRVEGKYNSYDNGHQLFEFYWPTLDKWVLADVDMCQMFVRDGNFLNLGEVSSLIQDGKDFELYPLTYSGLPRVDSSQAVAGEHCGFEQFAMKRKDDVKEWLRGMLAGPMMFRDGKVYSFNSNPSGQRRMQGYYPQAEILDREEWIRNFYSLGVKK